MKRQNGNENTHEYRSNAYRNLRRHDIQANDTRRGDSLDQWLYSLSITTISRESHFADGRILIVVLSVVLSCVMVPKFNISIETERERGEGRERKRVRGREGERKRERGGEEEREREGERERKEQRK